MDRYAKNIYVKLSSLLGRDVRILEIGCASGISMFRLAPSAGFYCGIDISEEILNKTRREAEKRGLRNIRLKKAFAHEIETLGESKFDIVILNSVIQCFGGHNYLREVMRQAIALLKERGTIFSGNVWDQELKGRFVEDLKEFRRKNAGRGFRTKIDRSEELFIPRLFFEDLACDFTEMTSMEYSGMLGDVESELSTYGYDALISIDKRGSAAYRERNREQYDRRTLEKYSKDRIAERSSPDSLAYLLYTSGTTGEPKGVMIEHHSLVNLATDAVRGFGITSSDRLLQFFKISFDASIYEAFMTIVAGAVAIFMDEEMLGDTRGLEDYMDRQGVTVINMAPSFLKLLNTERCEDLRIVITGGEPADVKDAPRLAQTRIYINAYGPTETSVCSLHHRMDRDNDYKGGIPIGRPIANTQCYILDDNHNPEPIGVVGELCISGEGVARGYLDDPVLTDAKFVPHPFLPAGKMYKTGDLARRLPDGDILFGGRRDGQVKIRGFRIEPDEINHILKKHPDVKDAIVTAKKSRTGEMRLVAYYVANHLEMWPSVAEFFVYDELLYHTLTHDERRNRKYRAAIERLTPGRTVVEIGTGRDAVLARFCVEAGAKRVYAVEADAEAYQKAGELIESLNLSDKITLVHGNAVDVELPEPGDVCVSEIVGSIGGCEGAAVIIEKCKKLFKPDCAMIPLRSCTRIAAVSLPVGFINDPGFSEVSGHYLDKIFDWAGGPFDVRVCLKGVTCDHLISDTAIFEDLDFSRRVDSEFKRKVVLKINRGSVLHGFLLWLNLHTVKGEVIDILRHEYCWLPVYFPVFYPGVEVEAGDEIIMECRGEPCDNRINPDYFIKGTLKRKKGESLDFSYDSWHHKPVFKSGPFYEKLFSDHPEVKIQKHDRDAWAKELKNWLGAQLPDYMIPSAFVSMESMPLTPHGKIDVKALPEPMAEPGKTIAPRDDLEKRLVDIWRDILKLQDIGIKDDFFELGGHSLKATQAVNRIQREFSVSITLRDFFKHPNVEKLAGCIRILCVSGEGESQWGESQEEIVL